MEKKKQNKQLLLMLLYIVIGCVAIYYLMPPLLGVFAPFIIAYIIAAMMEPLVRLLSNKLRVPRSIASAIGVFLTIFILGALVYFIVFRIVVEVQKVAENWAYIQEQIQLQYTTYRDGILDFYNNLSPETQSIASVALDQAKGSLTSLLQPVGQSILTFAANFATGIPSSIIFFVVVFLAAYFISSQRIKNRELTGRLLGTAAAHRISSVIRDLKHALGGYVKAQLIIMSIVFVILSIGLSIMNVQLAILLALFIAIFDALPVLGSGGIFIPWSIIAFANGDVRMGVSTLVMYFSVLAIRQSLEPKIVGQSIGVPPLVTLIAMYAGLRFFGIFGMILGPIIVLVVKNLYDAGAFDKMLGRETVAADTANAVADTMNNVLEKTGGNDSNGSEK